MHNREPLYNDLRDSGIAIDTLNATGKQIRITGMIHEPGQVTMRGRVN